MSMEKSDVMYREMLKSLKGKKCPGCGFKWKTVEDIKKREPVKGKDREIWCNKCWKPKTETVKERAIYVYLPSIETAKRWKELANNAGVSISKFVVEHVENSLRQEEEGYVSRQELLKRMETLKEENEELRKKNKMLDVLVDKLESELRTYRSKPFLEEEYRGVRKYEKELIELLRSRKKVMNDEILDALRINPLETDIVKAIKRQLENLERYGLIKVVPGGWKWNE